LTPQDPETQLVDRSEAMVLEAALQIMEHPAWDQLRAAVAPERLGICLGTTQGPIQRWSWDQERLHRDPAHRPEPPSIADPAYLLARLLDAGGPLACPSMACASGTAAIGIAAQWIRAGLCDAAVAGGVDALSELVIRGFASLKALDPERPRPFDRNRAGLSLGEGAGLVLLRAGRHRGAPEVMGQGFSSDAHHMTGPDPTGGGVARAVKAALTSGGVPPERVGFVSAHGTGTVFNDLMEGKALAQVFGHRLSALPVNSVKGAIGHTLGAAGALEAILCGQILRRGQVPPTANLVHLDPEIPLDVVHGAPRPGTYHTVVSTSSGFGGINAALVLQQPE
jgi:3-oxoacyl-[acyl-carrier-protein] synthase II